MAKTFEVKITDLGQSFAIYAGLAGQGAVYEIKSGKKTVAVLRSALGDFNVLKAVPEIQASRTARFLAEEVARDNGAIEISRLGTEPVYIVPPAAR